MEAVVVHVEHAYFVGGAEAVLYRPENAVGKLLLALKVQHRVHDVLECVCAFPDLHDASRRGGYPAGGYGLYRVYYHDIRLVFPDRLDYAFAVVAGGEQQPSAGDSQPVGAELYLPFGFLAGNVEYSVLAAHEAAYLEQQRGFSDARVAADEHQRAFHKPSAEHPVKLGACFFDGVPASAGGASAVPL